MGFDRPSSRSARPKTSYRSAGRKQACREEGTACLPTPMRHTVIGLVEGRLPQGGKGGLNSVVP